MICRLRTDIFEDDGEGLQIVNIELGSSIFVQSHVNGPHVSTTMAMSTVLQTRL